MLQGGSHVARIPDTNQAAFGPRAPASYGAPNKGPAPEGKAPGDDGNVPDSRAAFPLLCRVRSQTTHSLDSPITWWEQQRQLANKKGTQWQLSTRLTAHIPATDSDHCLRTGGGSQDQGSVKRWPDEVQEQVGLLPHQPI